MIAFSMTFGLRAHRIVRMHLPARPSGLLRALLALSAGGAFAVAHAVVPADPTTLSLEELMNIEVSSAAKKPQRLLDAATAIHVLGRDDIHRSGATSLPELFRSVPGVQVARIDGSRYSVSIRGFGNRYGGKLLVLLDGRTLYSPLFGSTYWEAQDVVLEDVERIEIIRGPGGTLWGANAVNGVVNIITRHAADTQGTHLEARGGSLEGGLSLRHGAALGDSGHWRAYVKADDHRPLVSPTGDDAHDAWNQARAGFRADWRPDAQDTLILQADAYQTRAQQSVLTASLSPPLTAFVPDTARYRGANLLARWQRSQGEASHWHVQAYLDRTRVQDVNHGQRVETFDLEWQHRFSPNEAHELTWGLGFRQVRDHIDGTFALTARPDARSTALYSGFLQDQIRLRQDLDLTLGTKVEHNAYTGVEWQPSARLLWRATAQDSVWASVSRAVQTPSRAVREAERNLSVMPGMPGAPGPVVIAAYGNPQLESQALVASEIGYRSQINADVNLDVAAFYNDYQQLLSLEDNPPQWGPVSVFSQRFETLMQGRTYGLEISGNWQVRPDWRLKAGYSHLHLKLRPKAGGGGQVAFASEGSSARNVLNLQTQHQLGPRLQLDGNLYLMGRLPGLGFQSPVAVDRYARLDLRLGWKVRPGVEINLIGRNLLDRQHTEFVGDDVVASGVRRSVLLQARWAY